MVQIIIIISSVKLNHYSLWSLACKNVFVRLTSGGFMEENMASEGNMPLEGKFKEFGKKGLAPLVDLVHRYQGDITPYLSAIDVGIQGAIDALRNAEGEQAEATHQSVAQWFTEAQTWFGGAKEKLSSKSPSDLLNFLETEARQRPAVMFASSYVVGLVVGRLGRHLARLGTKVASSATASAPESSEAPQFH
jgi:hypothetical protein